jgi:extracellular factor (EF) 3-hydroxypalmitic acid methyl ester biosynthesis protein
MFYPFAMSLTLNGNGAGHTEQQLTHQRQKKASLEPNASSSATAQESKVTFQTTDGVKFRGALSRLTRHIAVFELYNPSLTPRISEALDEFKIILHEREIYSGRAVVHNLVDAGTKVVCEVKLDEAHWSGLDSDWLTKRHGQITEQFKSFIRDWQKFSKVSPEFKIVIADMQSFLHDLRLWLDRVELETRTLAEPMRTQREKAVIDALAAPVIEIIDSFINRFESIVAGLEKEAHPNHYTHLRRQLHPLVMASPFAHRAFHKPLGYAGDYQMVDMMIRPPYEGDTLFAKTINLWLLGQSPAQAHRNRVAYLERKLVEEAMRAKAKGRVAKIFNLGCGPAAEVQNFLKKDFIAKHACLTLVDFNQETLQHLENKLTAISRKAPETATFRLLNKSVSQILKESGRVHAHSTKEKYDYIYCAGLFDYLSDTVCKQLMNIFYEMLAPDGLLLATNATDVMNDARPFRYSMEYILDWHLIYRDKNRFATLAPDLAAPGATKVVVEGTGANLFLEVKKLENV